MCASPGDHVLRSGVRTLEVVAISVPAESIDGPLPGVSALRGERNMRAVRVLERRVSLPPFELVPGIQAELASFEDLVRGLDEHQLATLTRCDGWTVRDVASHIIGSLSEALSGRPERLGTEELNEDSIRERHEQTGPELAEELNAIRAQAAALFDAVDATGWLSPAPGGHPGTLADGVETLWHDAYIHADDIRSALGMPPIQGPGLKAALSHIASELGSRQWVHALPFVMAATGRGDPTSFTLDDSVNIYRKLGTNG
jgi:uncharacterized protein (TIGR03083 family)